ncbi:hypothetical protein GJ496_009747 [Pomphorhynchus laevis]|nr:hypothetical protein GJ496_009747 [Pomphorhynchus laevis]
MDLEDFRISEMNGICGIINEHVNWIDLENSQSRSSVWRCNLKSKEIAYFIGSRSVLLKNIFQDLTRSSYSNLTDILDAIYANQELIAEMVSRSKSYRVLVWPIGHKVESNVERIKLIETIIDTLKLYDLEICLGDEAENTFVLIIEKDTNVTDTHHQHFRYYFGLKICDSQRHLLNIYRLSDRKFLSNTTLDPVLSFLMANIVGVDKNMLVCDPFCGSCSILLACTEFKAFTVGIDADYKLVHCLGRSSNHKYIMKADSEHIISNFNHYKTVQNYIDTILGDSVNACSLRKNVGWFDRILSDPPYGVRERCRSKSKLKKISNVYIQFLEFCANYLTLGGKCCYWIPFTTDGSKINSDFIDETKLPSSDKLNESDLSILITDHLPSHPCLLMDDICTQRISSRVFRSLVCLTKINEPANVFASSVNAVATNVKAKCDQVDNFRKRYFRWKKG